MSRRERSAVAHREKKRGRAGALTKPSYARKEFPFTVYTTALLSHFYDTSKLLHRLHLSNVPLRIQVV